MNEITKWTDCPVTNYSHSRVGILYLNIKLSSKKRSTYRINSWFMRGTNYVNIVLERAKVFDSLDSAKKWLVEQTLKELANTYQGLQELYK